MKNEEIEKIRTKYLELINDEQEIERAKRYKKYRDMFNDEFGIEKLKTMKLETYFNTKDKTTSSLNYKIEYGDYSKEINNPKITYAQNGLQKTIIYKKGEDYYIGSTKISLKDDKKVWEKLRSRIVWFLEKMGKINSYRKLNEYLEKDYFKGKDFIGLNLTPAFIQYLATQYYPDRFIPIRTHQTLNMLIEKLDLKIRLSAKCIEKSFAINQFLRENIKEINSEKYDDIIWFVWK